MHRPAGGTLPAATLGNWQIAGIVRNATDASYATFGTFNIDQGGGGALERFSRQERLAPSS